MKQRSVGQEKRGEGARRSWLTVAMTGETAAIGIPSHSGRKLLKAVTLTSYRLLLILIIVVGQLFLAVDLAKADPYPPYWQSGSGPAVHFQPEPWPDEPADPTQCGMNCGDWIPYTRYAFSINDARTQDPSNGGASPQNYVNIASSCIDESYPSIYYYLDLDNEVLMFRWRVEQIANTYATGPGAGSYSSSDPWSSALWTVFFDLNGDGYRDLAAHLDGSSGSPAAAIDRLVGIWADVPNSQSLNYYDDPNIYALAHNPTGFVDQSTSRILNFHTGLNPDANWPNGAAETIWNYGPSRSKVITLQGVDGAACNEYFVDYQIPLGLVDASAFSGPKIDRTTPFSMLFCTANSLNDPFQKDCAYQGDWIGDPNREGPFGDFVSFDDGTIDQPIVTWVDASGCGPTELEVKILDTIDLESGDAKTSVQEVGFYYYYDMNGDGEDNDGDSWTHAVDATNVAINRWTASWNSTGLLQGQYLVGVQAVDDGSKNDDGYANRVFSYLSQAEVDALGNDPATSGEEWYPNPDVTGVMATALFANACGVPIPFVSKTAEPNQVTTGETVTFTIAISNTHTDPLTVTVITDTLPPGFVYGDTVGGTLSSTTSPSVGATGDITWTFSPAAAVIPGSTDTLVFTSTAPSTVGTYANVVSVRTETSFGTLTSEPVQISVGAPRLSIAKSASTLSASPGDTITYTITYGNDSTVNVTDAVITDVLPIGLNLVSVLDSGSESGGIITWNVGDLQSGEGPFTARFVVTVTNPYPDAAAVPLVNTATIDGNETGPASARSAIFVDTPRPVFAIQKSADGILVSPGGRRVFTLTYANTGNATATDAVITDTMPDGFTFVSASPGGVNNGNVVTWAIGSVGAGVTGWVTFTADADTPFASANLAINTVTLDSNQTGLISDTYRVGVIEAGGALVCESYYFHDVQKTVGNIGTGRVASVTVPVDPAATLDYLFTGTNQEGIRFYSDPVLASALLFAEDVTGFWWINSISGGSGIENVATELYDYDPNSASLGSLLGSYTHPNYGVTSTPFTIPFTIPQPSLTVAAGHRLAIRFVADKQGGSNPTVQYAFDGASRDAQYSICETVGSPLLVLNKQISGLIAEPGARLTYTVEFGNAGSADITGAVITDTLPTGVTFDSATLNGSPVMLGNPSSSIYTLTVNSSDTGTAGQITAGQSGTLLVVVDVDAPLADGIDALLNTAVLDSNETTPITDTIPTAVLRPDLSIGKAANDTLLIPGDTVTFTLTVLNSGYATATNVIISDTLPATSYFTYVVNSTRLDGTTPGSDPVSGDLMSFDIGELDPGDSAQVTFQMYVHTSGVPDGVTDLGNTAAVTSTQTAEVSSDAVTVSISANPNLRLVKSLEPGGMLSPGDRITFTLVVSNVGASDAMNVQVRDPIPGDTAYTAGTLVYSGTAQTDVNDADEGRLDAAGNRVVFEVGTLPAGEARTMQFTVLVDQPLPNGITYFTNTATASAGNAAAKSSTVTAQATAAPSLTVSKTGADTLAYPAATVTADVSNATAFQVDDGSQLEVDQYVRVNGYDAQIVAISGSIITVMAPITATSGTTVTGSIIYSIGYANGGTAVANNVVITDTLPPQSAFITATTPYILSGNTITWTVSNLDPDESGSVQVTVFLTGTGSFTNTAYINSDETTPISDTVTTSVGGLRVRKRTATPVVTQTLTGTSATYVIEVENTSAGDAGGVIVTDTLAAGFTFSETLDITGGMRDPSTPDPSMGDARPAWGTFTVTGSSKLYITFTVSISDTVGPATYQNEVAVTSSDTSVTPFDPLLVPDEDVKVQVPVVRLSKTVTPTAVRAGYPVTYTIVAHNIGEAAAEGVIITDSLPSGFTYASTASTDHITATRTSVYATATPSWGVWDIAPSGKVTVTFVVTASTSTGTFSNTVLASSNSISIPTVSDTAPVTVTPLSDLAVTKAVTDTAPDVGSTVRFTVTVTNDGPSDATNVEITDQLPSGYTYVSDDGGGAYDSGTGVWDVGTVSASGSATLLITATVDASGDYANEAEVTAVSEDDPDSTPNDGSGDDYASVTPTPNPVADLRVEKQVSNSTPDVGSTVRFTVTVTNEGPSDTTGVEIGDSLPAGYTLVATDTTQGSYDSGTGAWTVGGLSNGASASLYITVTVEAAGPYANTASVTASDEDDDDSSNDSDTETPTPNPVADLALNLSVSDTAPDVNDTVVFTVVLTNAGPSNASGVQVSMAIPSGYTYVSDDGGGAYNSGTGLWDVGALNEGASVTLMITATVDASGTYDLYAQVEASDQYDSDSTPGDDSTTEDDDDVVDVAAPSVADLSLSKRVDNTAPNVNDSVIFALTVSNGGPDQATGVVVSDSLPNGYTFVSHAASLGIYTATTGEWNVGTIAAGTSVTLTITATVNASGDYSNYAQVWASDQYDGDSTPGDDSTAQDDDDTQATFPTAASADLSLAKTVDNVTPDVGSDILFTIAVTNSGPADANGVVISDTLSTGYTFVSYAASQGVYTATTGEWNVDTIAAGTSVTLTITATVNASGEYSNYAQVWASNQADSDSTPGDGSTTDDDDDTQSTIPNQVADLSVSKVSQPRPAVPGETITYTIGVVNAGPSALTAITLTDNLPATILNEIYAPSEGNYNSVTGAWTGLTFGMGDHITLTITGMLDPAFVGILQNTVVVTASRATDPDLTYNQDTDANSSPPVIQAIKRDTFVIDADSDGVPSPGDTLSYTIVITNSGGSSATGVTFSDVPDSNTSLVVGSVTTSLGFVTSGNAPGDFIVSLDIGSIPAAGSVTIVFQATIDSPLPAGVTEVANQGLVSSNELPDKPTDDPDTGPGDDETETPVLAAPVLEAKKTDTLLVDADGNGVPSPGDTLLYQVQVVNSGNIAATGVVFNDNIGANTALIVGTVQTSGGAVSDGNNPGDANVTVVVGPLAGGGSVDISYQVTIDDPLPAGVKEVANQGLVSSNELPVEPTDDPDTVPDDDETETPVVAGPDVAVYKRDFLVVDADRNAVPSPGDTLLYQITIINNGNGAATGVSFGDLLAANLRLLTGSVQTSQGIVLSGNGPADTGVLVTIGTLPGGGASAQIDYRATIVDPLPGNVTHVANQGLVIGDNLPSVPTDDPDTPAGDDPTVTPVTAAPDVDAYKSDLLFVDADGDGVASPGDTLLYLVAIVNYGNGVAEGLVFTDPLIDPNLTLVVGTVRTSRGAVTSGNGVGDTAVAVDVGPLSGGGGTVHISFQVVVTDPLPGGVTQVANQGFVSGDNIPTQPTDDPGSAEGEDDTETPVAARPSIEAYKRDSLLIDGDSNGEPSPGDTLLYQVTILNDGNQDATGVTYVDRFSDPNLILITGTVQTDQGLVLIGNDVDDASVMVDVGTLSGEGGVVHISFQAAIANPLPAGVTQVSNHGLASSNELPVEPTDDPDSPEEDDDTATDVTAAPDLEVYKTDFLFVDADGSGVPSPGDTLLYRVSVINNGNLAATGVLFEDVPDPNTTLVTGTVQTSLGTVTAGNSAGDTSVAVDVGVLPGGGASVDVSFLVMVNDPLPTGTTEVANQGLVSSNELPDEPTDDPATGVEDDETATPVTVEPALEAEKTDMLLVDADGDGIPSAGDTLLYDVTIFNTGNAAAIGVSFNDTLDPNTALVAGTVQTSLGTVTSGNGSGDAEVIVDVGALPGGGVVEISYQAVISDPLPAGVAQVANQGAVSGDNVAAEPTDDPDTSEDDDDTQTPLVICSIPSDLYEPDNLYIYAAEIPTDGTVQTHTLHVAADKDWVRFYAQVGKVYTITTSHLLADVDTVLELYDADGVTLLGENDDYLPGSKASRIVWTAPVAGWYYARVTHFDHAYDPRSSLICGNQFLLAIVEVGVCPVSPDTYEPDNLYTDALTISTDGSVQPHTFHVTADKDWASFYVFAGRVYTITTSQLGTDVDTVLELYDADGVTVLVENDDYLPGSNASRIVWTAPADGRYYVRITHFDRTYDPRQSLICGNHYLLAVEEAAICSVGPDVYEPDNLYPQAVDILANSPPQARTFHVAADKDWANFYAFAGHAYTVTTSQLGADVDTVLELYDADGVTLLDENDDYLPGSDASRIIWTAPADSRYYVRVTHFDRAYDPRESLVCGNQYLISVEATSCDVAPDIYESDNFYTQAPVIPTDGTVQTHTFHVAADKDWVKFFAWGGQIYTATTSRLSPDVDTVLQLYDADGMTLLLENDDYQSGSDASHLVWTAPADGWYFVRITHFDTTYDPRRSPVCGNQYQIAMRQRILDITKTAEVARYGLHPGDEILYTIVVTNLMNIPQTRIVITDAIPNYTTFVSGSASVSQGSVSGPDPLVADIGTLLPGQRAVFTFRVALREDSRGQTIINQAVVASDQRVVPVSSPLTSVIVYRYLYLPVMIR